MFKCVLFVAACMLFANCKQPAKVNPWSNTKKMLAPPGFELDIPLEKTGARKGQPDIFHSFKQRYCRYLRLDSLEAGFDSIQIRVRLGCDLCKMKHFIIIENTGLAWDAKLVTIGPMSLTFFEDEEYSGTATSVTTRTPLHGWRYFLGKMKELRITELPTGRDVGCSGCIDGTSYLFEIATRYKYRFFYYTCPESCAGKIWQAENVVTFAHLLEQEFDFTYNR